MELSNEVINRQEAAGYILVAARLAEEPAAAERLKPFIESELPPNSWPSIERWYWLDRGRLAALEGRKADALTYYPEGAPRAQEILPGPYEGRIIDDLMDEARALWKQLGGTETAMTVWSQPPAARIQGSLATGWRKPTKAMPAFELADLTGKTWRLTSLEGKAVLINVWATWCTPCKAELPHLQKLYEKVKDRTDLQILTLTIDEDLGAVAPFMKEKGYTFPVLPAYGLVTGQLDVVAIPQNWILDTKSVWRWTGMPAGAGGRVGRRHAEADRIRKVRCAAAERVPRIASLFPVDRQRKKGLNRRMMRKGPSRRELMISAIASATLLTKAGAEEPKLTLNQVKNDLYEIEGDGGNVAVFLTDEGVILVDDKFERDYEGIMAHVKSLTAKPVKYVLSTHYHADHSGGNTKFLPSAEVISTANARDAIVEHKQANAPPGVSPARVVFKEEAGVFLGGKEVHARYCGRGHTNGDAVVYFPALRTLHTGDLMAGKTPLIDYNGGGSLVEWTKTLDEAMKLDFDTVIPGHGPVTNKAGLLAYRNNVDKLRTRASEMFRDGRSQEDVGKVMIAEFGWAADGLQMQWSLPGMMKELKGAGR